MNTVFDPRGNPTGLVDAMLGTAFPIVRHVSENVEYIKHVSANLPQIYRIWESIGNLDIVFNNINIFDTLFGNLTSLNTLVADRAKYLNIYDNRVQLLNLENNIEELYDARDYIVDFSGRFGSVDAAITATEAIRVATNTQGQAKVDAAEAIRVAALAQTNAQVVIATTQAGLAAASKTVTDTNVTLSTAAKTASETARDASFVNANTYATEAAGRAAVADNAQFQHVSTDGLYIQRRIRVDASNSPTIIAAIPTSAYIQLINDRVKVLPVDNQVTPLIYDIVDNTDQIVLTIEDPAGLSPLSITSTGRVILARARVGLLDVRKTLTFKDVEYVTHQEANYPFAITDANDNTVFYVDATGVHISGVVYEGATASSLVAADLANKVAANTLRARPVSGIQQPTKQINTIVINGQSLGEAMETWPALSKTQKFGNLMLGQDIRPTDRNAGSWTTVTPGGFQPLVAKVRDTASPFSVLNDAAVAALAVGNGAAGENIGHGMANFASLLVSRKTMTTPNPFCVICPAVSGKSIEQLSKVNGQDGTNRYARFTQGLQAIQTQAVADGKTHVVTAYVWVQGEYDYAITWNSTKVTKALYKAMLVQHMADVFTDVKAITGQTEDPLFLIYQTGASYTADVDMNGLAGLHVGMAQLEFALENPKKVAMFSPVYPVTDKGGHLDSNGSRWMAMQAAKVYNQVAIEGREFRPLSPRKFEVVDTTHIRIHFHVPSGKLEFDTPYAVSTPQVFTNKGFRVTDGSGTKTINNVAIVADSIIEITLATAIDPNTAYVWYAGKTTYNGNGSLRDTDTTLASEVYEYLAGSGMYASADIAALKNKPYPLHNWCAAFYYPVTYAEV